MSNTGYPRTVFWLVWAVALLPLLGASLAYFSGWRPAEHITQGELYPPGVTLSDLHLGDPALTTEGSWRLILLVGEECGDECHRWQALLPNLHASLGKDRDRLLWQQVENNQQGVGLLLADPQGFMVTRYRLSLPPQSIIKDLKRLLRISKVG
ncbi:hypothetical protein [Amphritea pacifica]|uniref:Thioredoxin domain-containing protein n=1 Tax=Amphritea pacifica TaxID=2811233 RepID=A0ABS2WDA4_9GAMM|nr:hypothetical protein [Amphritea pacifica]MBN0989688.1 hypothetical protein [Amphritea pacifica]MBN1008961.1 hypothetical protein [Amphritea pacifica]